MMPPGLILIEEAISREQESTLLGIIADLPFQYYAYDPDNHRASVSYGYRYQHGDDSFVACDPIPIEFAAVVQMAADRAGVAADAIAELLINRYDPGAIIQPHIDKPVWDLVIGLSLGAATTMLFAKPDSAPLAVRLNPRSLYIQTGDSRHLWQHCLPPAEAMRFSLTFRTVSKLGLTALDRVSRPR